MFRFLGLIGWLCICFASAASAAEIPSNLQRENLIAWCIVPFDSQARGPVERAEMLSRLGLKRVAYDWREAHVPTFETEILAYQQAGIEYFAFWGAHEQAFALFQKYNLHPQIWQTAPSPAGATQKERVEAAVKQLLPLVERTRKMNCRLGLYNHGGWGGEPENLVVLCRALHEEHEANHVGIVYNLHHAHNHIGDFAEVLERVQPYLLCLNLNGMTDDGEKRGLKILPLGEGEHDVRLLQIVQASGYDGPIGIIGHTQDDVEERLADNLDGLDWILPQLSGGPAGPKPMLRTYSPAQATTAGGKPIEGELLDGQEGFRRPPLTVECRATLSDREGYNILTAAHTKKSPDHWELFTMKGTGRLTAYLPGAMPDHVTSEAMVCDGRPHTLAMQYEPQRVRLLVDGRVVADQAIQPLRYPPPVDKPPFQLGIGRLVEGGIGCRGEIDWVRLSRGVRELGPEAAESEIDQDEQTLLLWRRVEPQPEARGGPLGNVPPYSPRLATTLLQRAQEQGDAHRGMLQFAAAKTACLSCHKIGEHGGSVGPELGGLLAKRPPVEIVEAVLWPHRKVDSQFNARLVIDTDGKSYRGYVVKEDPQTLVLRDPTRPNDGEILLARNDIEILREVGTLMPENLTAAMTAGELSDLLRFLLTLGREEGVPPEELAVVLAHAYTHHHGPVSFEFDRSPLDPKQWPSWQASVNRDRVYDFYAKQAEHFRRQPSLPPMVTEFPGLDGGTLGHWGNQTEESWASDRWNSTRLGSVQCGIFRGNGLTIPRAVCIQLGHEQRLSACFNPQTMNFDALWTGGFVTFSSVRHGFMHGVQMEGQALPKVDPVLTGRGGQYRGFYRHGDRVLFLCQVDGVDWLSVPGVDAQGRFTSTVAPVEEHPQRDLLSEAPTQWPEVIETPITLGDGSPYAVDTIGLPFENPWNALLFCGGHAFLPDGSALVCTMQGDVWRVSDFAHPAKTAKWKRFASGLSHALGLWIDHEGIFVLGRDQITRLHDLNGDHEADFYECFCNAYETSSAGHDFICGLERDAHGRFYTASGNQGLLRISPDGSRAEVIATGFRNPDGVGLYPDGTVTVPCSEGEWTPASMICAVRASTSPGEPPHFGYRGPIHGRTPELPLVYLPRGLDNSSGGQIAVDSDRWGPLQGQLLHFSFGTGAHFLVLRDEVAGQLQGAVVPLPGEFRSGAHRGRFSPADGQLYVSGMQGWGCYTPDLGCFQRVRYTGEPVQLPVGFHVHENGVAVTFAQPLNEITASDLKSHFAQCWNYRYGPGYGSPELSPSQFGVKGHDTLAIAGAHVLDDGRTLFLELPDLRPVNQLHLHLQTVPGRFQELFLAVHRLDSPRTDLPGYKPRIKAIAPHPIHADLALATRTTPNPFRKRLKDAREITLETGTNLTFASQQIRVRAGEPLAFTLINPDVVPHNWALTKPGTLERVGDLANRLIADPDAAVKHYIPESSDVLAYTDVVLPGERHTIYFRAPSQPGRYPYLCTFPGHWKVMNGELVVEAGAAGK